MTRQKTIIWGLMLLLFMLLLACVGLPDYASPKLHVSTGDAAPDRQGFAYRPLAVEDFQAESLPDDSQKFAKRIHARSCLSIRPNGQTMVRIRQGQLGGKPVWTGTYHQLSFEAVFNPECSWWNSRVPRKRIGYVLQHEQIHFAIAELSARRLTQKATTMLASEIVVGNSPQQVRKEMTEKMEELVKTAMRDNLKEQTSFDEDTSMIHNPKAQKRWLAEIESRLKGNKQK